MRQLLTFCQILIFTLLSLFSYNSNAQTEKSNKEIEYCKAKIEEHFSVNPDSTWFYLNKYNTTAQQLKLWDQYVYSFMGMGNYSTYSRNVTLATKYLDNAESYLKKYEKELKANQSYDGCFKQLYILKAYMNTLLGDYIQAEQDVKSVMLNEEVNHSKDFYFDCLQRMVNILMMKDDNLAVKISNQAIDELVREGLINTDEASFNIWVYFNNTKGQAFNRDVKYAQTCQLLLNVLNAEQKRNITYYLPETCKLLSYAYAQQDKIDSALYYINIATQEVMKSNPNDLKVVNFNLAKADVLYLAKQYEQAEKDLLQNLIRQQENFDGRRSPYIARTFNLLGKINDATNRQTEALEYYQKALMHVSAKFKSKHWDRDPDLEDIRYKQTAIDILTAKSKTLMTLYRNTNNSKYLIEAYKVIELAKEASRLSYQEFNGEDNRQSWAQRNLGLYEQAIGLASTVYEKTKEKIWYEKALEYVEIYKAGLVQESLRKGGLAQVGGIPPADIELERKTQYQLHYYQQQKFIEEAKGADMNKDVLALFNRQDLMLTKRLDSLQQVFKQKYPLYFKFKYTLDIPSLVDIQKGMLDDKSALIEYFVGKDKLYVFGISKSSNTLAVKDIDKGFFKSVSNLRYSISDVKYSIEHSHDARAMFATEAHNLYNTLLKDALVQLPADINRLVIVQDGVTSYIPFDVLIEHPATGDDRYMDMAFVLQKYSVAYASSTSLLRQQQHYIKSSNPKMFGGFAPDYEFKYDPKLLSDNQAKKADLTRRFSRRDGLTVLPGVANEVQYIKEELGDGDIYLKESASERGFKAIANQYRIVHCAMHALLDDRNSLYSALLFTPVADSTEDNELTAAELYLMNLNCELVVLSACNTGYGELKRGEGGMGLSRAFMYAGVPSTVTSLWEVSDVSAQRIMTYFYRYLKQGYTKDEALRMAKLDYIKKDSNPVTANPFYWASLTANGDMKPMYGTSSLWRLYVGLGCLVALGGVFMLNRRNA